MPRFFGATFQENLTGLGLIAFGAGLALLILVAVTTKHEVAEARHSPRRALIGGLVLAVHSWVVWLAALGLVGFGALCLAIAVGLV